MPKGVRAEGCYPRPKLLDHRPAMRRCLGPCGALFHSNGPGNRVCPKCERRNLELSRRNSQ